MRQIFLALANDLDAVRRNPAELAARFRLGGALIDSRRMGKRFFAVQAGCKDPFPEVA